MKIDSLVEVESEQIEDGAFSEDADFENVKFDDDDDEDNENAISVEKLKRDCLGSPESELKLMDDGGKMSSYLFISFFLLNLFLFFSIIM